MPRKPNADAFALPEPKAVRKFVEGETSRKGAAAKSTEKKTRMLVYLDPALHEDLAAGSTRFNRSMSAIVEDLLTAWAEEHRKDLDATKQALRMARGE